MHKIPANASGTKLLVVSDKHLETIHRYQLLSYLIDSNGVIDEGALDKLKFNLRALLETELGCDRALLDLCLDVVFHSNMKAFGLKNLVELYRSYVQRGE